MSGVGIDPDGHAVWKWAAHDVGVGLLQLLSEPGMTVAEHPEIPSTRGVYVFSDGDRAVMVGVADDLRRALRAAVRPDAEDGSSYLSFYLARSLAKRAGVDVERERRDLEADREFIPHYRRAKEAAPHLQVRFLGHQDLVQRQLLALFSELHLNPSIPSRLYPEWEGPASLEELPSHDQGMPPAGSLTTIAAGGAVATIARQCAVCASLDLEDADALASPLGPSQAQLGRAIRQIRIEARLTQEQVANWACIHSTHLSFIEIGKRSPSWKVLTAISAALGVSVAALVARAEES